MGWASGGELMESVINIISAKITDFELRKEIYIPIIRTFESFDCDVLEECKGIDDAYDEALIECGYEEEDYD